jgi:formate/nitrite transporter FocA (FNT family)
MAEKSETERLTADEIYQQVTSSASRELDRSVRALAFSGVAGGITMGLTGLGVAAVKAVLPGSPFSELVPYFFYPVGFIAVIIGRAQLFTENTLYPVVLVLAKPRFLDDMLRLWGTVLLANIAGALLFAALAIKTGALRPDVAEELVRLGQGSVGHSGAALFWSGVIGGWIIALVAWLVSASQWTIGQVTLIWLLTFIVGVGHFAHCIAGSGEILSAVLANRVSTMSYLHWITFAPLGNICGGVTLVSLLNWGQVSADQNDVFDVKQEATADDEDKAA